MSDEKWMKHQERMQADEAVKEKRRRVYYQDIVYAVCNRLDRVTPGTTVCGSWAEPSTQVQDRMDDVIQQLSEARDRIESLEAELTVVSPRHRHVASADDTDTCAMCGRNVRDRIHIRCAESQD